MSYPPPVRAVTKQRHDTRHLSHLVASILTGGLWVPFWIWFTVRNKVGPRKKTVTTYR